MNIGTNLERLQQEARLKSLGIPLPRERAWNEYRRDRSATPAYQGLCYAPQQETVEFDDLRKCYGTSIVVVPSLPQFRRLAEKQLYDFFIIDEAGIDTLEAISIIGKACRRHSRKVPPISVVWQENIASRELLYVFKERIPIMQGIREKQDRTAHITTGLEEYLR